MISIIIPTRNTASFAATISNLAQTCSNSEDAEIIIKTDSDTTDARICRSILKRSPFRYHVLNYPRGRGWLDHYKFFNDMARIASGDFIWVLADDIGISGKWLQALQKKFHFKNKAYVVYPAFRRTYLLRKPKMLYRPHGWPCISRYFYNAIGKNIATESVNCDRYIKNIATDSKRAIMIRSVIVTHNTYHREHGGLKNYNPPPDTSDYKGLREAIRVYRA